MVIYIGYVWRSCIRNLWADIPAALKYWHFNGILCERRRKMLSYHQRCEVSIQKPAQARSCNVKNWPVRIYPIALTIRLRPTIPHRWTELKVRHNEMRRDILLWNFGSFHQEFSKNISALPTNNGRNFQKIFFYSRQIIETQFANTQSVWTHSNNARRINK